MSEEQNVELLRTAFRAFESGDIEGVLGLCHEDIEITQPVELSDAAPRRRGHEGVLEAFAICPEQCVVNSDLRGDARSARSASSLRGARPWTPWD